MKRVVAAALAVLSMSLVVSNAGPAPTPVACAVSEQEPRCEAVAQIDGNIAYMVNGSAKFAIYRGTTRRKCVILGGHEVGNLWAGQVQTGDVLRIDFRGGYAHGGIAGGTLPIGTAGFGDQSVC